MSASNNSDVLFLSSVTRSIPLSSLIENDEGARACSSPIREILVSCVDLHAPDAYDLSVQEMPVDLLLCVDVSGSMRGVRDQLCFTVRQVARAIRAEDRLAVVSFDSRAKIDFALCHLTQDNDAQLQSAIGQMYRGGGTNIGVGLSACFDQLQKHASTDVDKTRCAPILLLSDGCTSGMRGDELVKSCRERVDRPSDR